MKSVIYFYTGTGNSLWVARLLAQELKDASLVAVVADSAQLEHVEGGPVGLVFPVHIWGLPPRIVDFVRRFPASPASYCFACLQWCPQEAIQFGKKTPKYERYHHPEVTVQDMLHYMKEGQPMND